MDKCICTFNTPKNSMTLFIPMFQCGYQILDIITAESIGIVGITLTLHQQKFIQYTLIFLHIGIYVTILYNTTTVIIRLNK
jgi:hypothetical protein